MTLRASLRRLNPFKPDLVSLTEPPFDPKKQHALLGALAAIEAFVGAILALPFLAGVSMGVWLLVERLRGRHPYRLHHHLNMHWRGWFLSGACTLLAAVLLGAGLALLLGRPYRYRAQGVLLVTVIAVVGACAVARELGRVVVVTTFRS